MATLGLRIRFAPMRYAEGEAPAGRPRQSTPEEEAQREVNRVLREQIATNKANTEEKALEFRCALTAKAPRKVSVRPNGVRYDTPQDCEYLGAQAKKLAVASDGHYYDFSKITQYIRDNMHHELLSPITGERMLAVVYHTEKDRKGNKLKTVAWTPQLYASEEDADEGADCNANAGQEPMTVD
jgi:hypothetical protein